MLSQRKSCYCAFCKVERKVYLSKHLSLIGVISLSLLSVVLTYALFRDLDVRGLSILSMLLILGEIFQQTKWRTSMICRNCGFDPVMYIKDPNAAGLKIKAFLDRRKDSPESLLKPAVLMPVKKVKKGINLSLKY